jgi:chromosome partitioning protein
VLTLAVVNQKGGVGKTTTAINLGRAAVRAGLRVLLVDADPQGNLTELIAAVPVPQDAPGLADVLTAHTGDGIDDVTIDTVWTGATLVPTVGEGLGLVRDELVVSGAGREKRLRTALARVATQYDLVLVDCGPGLEQLTVNAMTAADAVVVVTQSKLLSASGVAKLLQTIDVVRDAYNPALAIGGVVINGHEARTLTGQYWLEEITGSLTQVLQPPVPKLAVINDAAEAGKGLDEWGTAEGRVLAEIYDGYLSALRANALSTTEGSS